MFCPSNDTLQSITEKTKLLAQKCTQQIRVQQCLSPLKKDGAPLISRDKDATAVVVAATANAGITITEKPSSFKCFCPCKGPLNFKVLAKKIAATGVGGGVTTATKETTTKWYVKVIQMNKQIVEPFYINVLNVIYFRSKNRLYISIVIVVYI